MDNITHTVKEKMKKVYSFTGTQLLITGIWIIILLSIVTGTGTGKWHMKMKNHMMRWNRQEMTQQYDTQWSDGEQKQGMMRGKLSNQEQPTPPSTPTNTGN